MVRAFIHSIKIKLHTILYGQTSYERTGIDQVGIRNERVRNDWVIQALSQLPSGLRLLDAGAGEQPYKKHCTHLHYVSQDFAQYNPATLEEGLQMKDWDYGKLDIISDVTAIPEPDASFDAILCTEVIEHIVNPIDAIKEFSRLLKPDGTLILTAPFCSMTHFAPYHFYSGYNRFFYENILLAHGFEIIEMTENGNYFEYLAQELRRLPAVGVQYANIEQGDEIKVATEHVLSYLHSCSSKDTGSKELLYFGMHVRAKKIKQAAL